MPGRRHDEVRREEHLRLLLRVPQAADPQVYLLLSLQGEGGDLVWGVSLDLEEALRELLREPHKGMAEIKNNRNINEYVT